MSDFAHGFAGRHFNFGTEGEVAYALDADLQPFRDLLEALRTDYYDDRPCWCRVNVRQGPGIKHTEACNDATDLLSRLRM